MSEDNEPVAWTVFSPSASGLDLAYAGIGGCAARKDLECGRHFRERCVKWTRNKEFYEGNSSTYTLWRNCFFIPLVVLTYHDLLKLVFARVCPLSEAVSQTIKSLRRTECRQVLRGHWGKPAYSGKNTPIDQSFGIHCCSVLKINERSCNKTHWHLLICISSIPKYLYA